MVATISVFGQNTISGTVLDEEGIPLMGATVVVKNSSTGVITNDEGSFVPCQGSLELGVRSLDDY